MRREEELNPSTVGECVHLPDEFADCTRVQTEFRLLHQRDSARRCRRKEAEEHAEMPRSRRPEFRRAHSGQSFLRNPPPHRAPRVGPEDNPLRMRQHLGESLLVPIKLRTFLPTGDMKILSYRD